MLERQASPTRLRWLLLAGAVINLAGGVQLFVLGDRTQLWFAWTVDSPPGAGVLGAFAWAAAAALVLAFAEHSWGAVRPLLPGAFVFASLGLAASLMDMGHLHAVDATPAGLAAAGWLATLVLGIAAWIAVALRSEAGWQVDPPAGKRLSLVLVVLTVLLALVSFGVGGWLYVRGADARWPWPLDQLTAQVAGAWLVAGGFVAATLLLERDSARGRAAFGGIAVAGALLLLALLRYPFPHSHPLRLVAYVAAALLALVAGFLGLRRGFSDPRPRAAPFVR